MKELIKMAAELCQCDNAESVSIELERLYNDPLYQFVAGKDPIERFTPIIYLLDRFGADKVMKSAIIFRLASHEFERQGDSETMTMCLNHFQNNFNLLDESDRQLFQSACGVPSLE